jgi:RHH-type proline utilization regulon transcriptional repressor/proline dehydrogenase/delta 1-pyrroline-5-carboxylate dehydrogenase
MTKILNETYLGDETQLVEKLISAATLSSPSLEHIQKQAEKLVTQVRKTRLNQGGLDAFLYQYDLSSNEGIALMCLAEALLRIPDKATVNKLIRDKITRADWEDHLGKSESLFVNAATWGLMLTGKIISHSEKDAHTLNKTLKKLVSRGGEPFIRKTMAHAMKILGNQFVMGQTITKAIKRSIPLEKQGYLFSYDMLGEAARTMADADKYFHSYQKAIEKIGESTVGKTAINGSGISIKLSALHPRYEYAQREEVISYLTKKLLVLAIHCKTVNIGLTVDAEEAERLDISIEIIKQVFCDPALKNWEGFGLALQSYQKRGYYLIDELAEIARSQNKRFMVRLIKGAYWDSEIKNAQVKGLDGYPVFTRKTSTDVSFLACAKKILSYSDAFYPAFATHNAYSLAAVLEMAKLSKVTQFEFQCLHGMGYTLYDQVVGKDNLNIPCRVYAPVGGHEDLLAYLVRRLLENGANSSFVNRIIDEKIPVSEIIMDPVKKLSETEQKPHPHIPLPRNLYGSSRQNSMGINLTNPDEIKKLYDNLKNPSYDKVDANTLDVETVLEKAHKAFEHWEMTSVETRAECLDKTADLLEERMAQFMSITIEEGKKTIPDAIAEVREAIDFCRYYAKEARENLSTPQNMPGPTGETNQLFLRGRGPMVCISPWNFPLAIFMGQVTAALVTGNPVIAKPAGQTLHIAMAAVSLLHEAGIPKDVLQLCPISGKLIGSKIIPDNRIKGVIFTGSTETAQQINQTLANRSGQLVPFIAETGGQNAMIVDSSALPEQVVADVITSAFMSAGQRCSALRVLFLQDDIADKTIEMLKGAMETLSIGNPRELSTDIGPVIDNAAKKTLVEHVEKLKHDKADAKLIHEIPLKSEHNSDSFFGPCAFEINNINLLTREVFGPVLHIVRFKSKDLDQVINSINNTGYGLTMGIHSRIDETVHYIQSRMKAGNIYVNRSMIGAVVGTQPFGGEGLSGTGPKAGGPHYLLRLCTERTVTINTTAAGGNASLMSLNAD